MRGSKEVLWAVVISAALITTGLILSCGDDDGVGCGDVCDKLDECDMIPGGGDVEDCIEGCEEEMDQAEEEEKELMECIVDTDCDDVIDDCWCPIACGKIIDECEEWDMEDCLDDCESLWDMDLVFCVLDSDCEEVEGCF